MFEKDDWELMLRTDVWELNIENEWERTGDWELMIVNWWMKTDEWKLMKETNTILMKENGQMKTDERKLIKENENKKVLYENLIFHFLTNP